MSLGRCLWLLTLLATASGGCVTIPTRPEPQAAIDAELFPLRPGTFWVYEVHDAEGRVALQRVLVRGPIYLKTYEAAGTVVEESGGVAGELSLDVSWHPVVYYRRGDFLYKFSGLGYVDEELREYRLGNGEEKVLPADPDRHPEWESDFQVFQLEPGTGYAMRTFSTSERSSEPVRVRAGTFRDCLRVETKTVAFSKSARPSGVKVIFRYVDWYAPGVGLVKSLVEVEDAPRPVSLLELVSFRAGGDPR